MNRCRWCNLKNPLYVEYHDREWGVFNLSSHHLYEMLILESFQAGLSFECILNKREAFRKAYDNFDIQKVMDYNEKKIEELMKNEGIVRNRKKIEASIKNSHIFYAIEEEYRSFKNYIYSFTMGKIYYECDKTTNEVSDLMSKDLIKRGMSFVGSTIIYSFLQAIGIINSHEKECFLHVEK